MLGCSSNLFLVVSADETLLHALTPLLEGARARIHTVESPHAALAFIAEPEQPCLVLADIEAFSDIKVDCFKVWLNGVRTAESGHRVPIVLLSDVVSDEWSELVLSGVLDDLIPRPGPCAMWRLRLAMVLRSHHRMREAEVLRETVDMEAELDPLTHIYNRGALLSVLFRETDRVQRMRTALSLILFDLDDFGQCNVQVGSSAADDILRQVVARTMRLLRSYDAFGRMEVVGKPDEIPEVQREVGKLIEGTGTRMVGIERFAFYERAKKAYAVIQTQERRFYADFAVRKGVVPPGA